MADAALDVSNHLLASYQRRFRSSVATPSRTRRFPERFLRLELAALFAPQAQEGSFVAAHDDQGVRAADESAPSRRIILFA
jgi:hypothetical protein